MSGGESSLVPGYKFPKSKRDFNTEVKRMGKDTVTHMWPLLLTNRDEIHCKGSLDKVMKWYESLKILIDNMGFKEFLSVKTGNLDNRLIHTLLECWMGQQLPHKDKYSSLSNASKMFPEVTRKDISFVVLGGGELWTDGMGAQDMRWFMDMAGTNGERTQLPISAIQISYPCPLRYTAEELCGI
ncbi:hypothetical protein GIB67_036796 [Kingdonia uniflora]|uniref:Uncharacterized protein n=1 Tax=Kingdonia uniflora TaxID=39325 RepID=A0A7J7LWV1_9MAGN|nr:hypothetical protein GIB67_036796 [Kingdonia uniflora]